MAFKILITEDESPLALALLGIIEDMEHTAVCPSMLLMDWADESKVEALLKEIQPAIFINTLQFHSPQFSVSEKLLYQIPAMVCLNLKIKVIHISSHEVFSVSQQKGKPMLETTIPEADTPIGKMFLASEQAFLGNPECITLRVPWVVDLPGGPLDKVLTELVYGESVQASASWSGCFVSIAEIARVVIAISQQILCESNNWGVVHMRSSDFSSEMEFIDYLQRFLEKSGCSVSAEVNVVSNEYRMMQTNGWLAGDRCTNNFGIQFRSWRHGIKSKVGTWVDNKACVNSLAVK